jgi:hypothetical protein
MKVNIVPRYNPIKNVLPVPRDSVNHDFIYPLDLYVAYTPVRDLSS